MLNYSSGTTGEPKGIPHAHKDLPLTAQLYGVDAIGLREDDRTFSVAKLFFTYGSGGNLIWPWYAGASIILSPAPSRVATNLLETIDRFKPTVFNGVPTSYASMMAVDRFTENYDLSSIRMCISAGEALPVAIWHDWKKRTGHEIVEGIGTTENFALYLTNRLGDTRPGSAGKPVDGLRDQDRRRRRATRAEGRDRQPDRQGRDRGPRLPAPVRAEPPNLPRRMARNGRPILRGRRRATTGTSGARTTCSRSAGSGSHPWRSRTP